MGQGGEDKVKYSYRGLEGQMATALYTTGVLSLLAPIWRHSSVLVTLMFVFQLVMLSSVP